jgi:hypothetical protein
MKIMQHVILSIALVILLTQGLIGCGGGSTSSKYGSVSFRVQWPERNRLIPTASDSIKVEVKDGEKVVGSLVLQRPAEGGVSEAKIGSLPVKTLTNVVTAYPFVDASGVAQAEATGTVTIKANEEVRVSITLVSTIDRLEPLGANPLRLAVGEKYKLSVSPKNAKGELVLILDFSLVYSSDNPSVIAVTNQLEGEVTALAKGTAKITITEPESGKKFIWDVSSIGCTKPENNVSPCAVVMNMPDSVKVGESYEVRIVASAEEGCRYTDIPNDNLYSVFFPGSSSLDPNAYIRPGENIVRFTVQAPRPSDPDCYAALTIQQRPIGIQPWRSLYFTNLVK